MTKPPPSISRLWKTGSIYVGSFWLNSALPILMTPVLTRFLSPADYGVSAMWQVLLSFTIPIIGLSTHAAINRRYFHTSKNPEQHHADMRDYISSVFPILAVTSLVVILAYVLAYPRIANYLLPTSRIWILVVPAVAIATFLYNINLSYLNAEMRAKTYALFNNGHVLATSLFSVILVVGLGWDWQGRVAGGVLGMSLAGAASVAYLWHRGLLAGTVRRDMTTHALLFSLPLLPHILANMVRGVSDRVFLSQITNLHEIGLYSVALSLAGIFSILGSAAQQAWIPWLYAHLSGKLVDRVRIVKITYVAFSAIAIAGIIFAAFAPFAFGLLLGPQFEGSVKFVWWLTGASVLTGFYSFLAPYITYVERNKYSSYISMVTLAVNITLNFVLIHYYGVIGVAMASFFTALYEFVAVFLVANYCIPMPWVTVFFRSAPALSGAENQGGSGT